jgi:hypothetical protein
MFNKLLSFTKKVQDLPDQPALTPADLKAQFDAAPDELRQYFNNFIDALMQTTSGDSGAKNVGATTVGSMTGNDVQTILGALDTRTTALEATQTVLWTGTKMPLDTDTITPSKKLSQCRHGWILLWSDFDSPSTANDWDFHCTYIPKVFGAMFSGKEMLVTVPSFVGGTTTTNVIKSIFVYDDHIVGVALNNDGTLNNNDVCLRNVFEW